MTSATLEWHRLSPVSIIFFVGKILQRIVKDALPGLAPLAVIIFNSDNKTWIISLAMAAVVTFIVLNAVLQFLYFRYQVQGDKLLVHEGIFKKKQRVISFERIQNVNILQPFYFKPLSLVNLQIETAGSKDNEANLAGLPVSDAENLKQKILSIKKLETEQIENEPLAQQQELATAATVDLIKFGITSNGMFWFFVILAPVFGMLDDFIDKWVGEENLQGLIDLLGGGLTGAFMLLFGSIVGLFSLMIGFSILGAILRYHNYRLTIKEDTLKRYGGLISTHEESAKLRKIQAFVNKTNFIGKYLKVENVYLKQASAQQNNASAKNKLFLIPTRTRIQTNQLLSIVFGPKQLHQQLENISPRYITKTWLMLMLPLTISGFLIGYVENSYWPLLIILLGLPLWLLVRLRWQNYGYVIDQHFGAVRKGFWGYKRITFQLFKVQRVVISQSLIQRRRNLASLTIFLASDRITIPYIPIEHAQLWFDQISYQIETTEKNWF